MNGSWMLQPTHGEYPQAMKDMGARFGVAYIDMTRETEVWLQALGETKSRAYFVWLEKHVWPNHPDGRQDDTHLSALGATAIAKMTARCLDRRYPELPFLLRTSTAES